MQVFFQLPFIWFPGSKLQTLQLYERINYTIQL